MWSLLSFPGQNPLAALVTLGGFAVCTTKIEAFVMIKKAAFIAFAAPPLSKLLNRRATAALAVLLAVSGCATVDRHSVLPPITAKIPQSLRQACAGVVSIPARDLTVAEVARLWGRDRAALLTCMRRHAALSQAVSVLEAGK